MKEIVTLLKEKNHYLKKFYTINKAELLRLNGGDFSRLDYFYQSRENILDMISHIEAKLEKNIGGIVNVPGFTDDDRTNIRNELFVKDEVVGQILDQDLQILSMIEVAKTELIKELQEVRRHRQVIGAYHSGPQVGQKRLRTIK